MSAGMVTADAVSAVANHDAVTLAALGLLATMLALLGFVIRNGSLVRTAAEQATQANHAVNNVGPGEHRLYDQIAELRKDVERLVVQQDDFNRHGWATLPADLATAPALTETIRELQHDARNVREKLDVILAELRNHVEWEMAVKHKGTT